MLQQLARMQQRQRVLIFVLLFVGGLMLIIAVTVFLILWSINTTPRELAVAVVDTITVTEFAQLPDDDAYPARVAVGADGLIYTGSYATGALWIIGSAGQPNEFPDVRDAVGSLTGLDVAADGTLYLLDRLTFNPRSAGGTIWRVSPQGIVTELGGIPDETGFIAPGDLTLDADGNLYVTDRGRREVWRFAGDGSAAALVWTVPGDDERATEVVPTGIAYDASTSTLIVSDSEAGTIFRVNPANGQSSIVYRYPGQTHPPGFDGVTVAPDGTIYAAALGQRSVVQVQNGDIVYLARGFRGGSDVAYHNGRLIVTNFDQRSLVLPGLEPQRPFALDVIELGQ